MNSLKNKIKAVTLGHAVGGALGVPVEFLDREERKRNPRRYFQRKKDK